jgi:DNA replication protein DnaD
MNQLLKDEQELFLRLSAELEQRKIEVGQIHKVVTTTSTGCHKAITCLFFIEADAVRMKSQEVKAELISLENTPPGIQNLRKTNDT